jgi:tetratricopeptide (TPR) repeat protein
MVGMVPRAQNYAQERNMMDQLADYAKAAAMGNRLLDESNPEMAMAYFWRAAELCAKSQLWELAAQNYEKSAYCYELTGMAEKAIADYELAADAYSKAGKEVEVTRAHSLANSMRQRGSR